MKEQQMNRQMILVSRPKGMPDLSHFKLVESSLPLIQEGGILIKALYLSVDPYMRMRMSDAPSYSPPFALNRPLIGGVVGKVVESKNEQFKLGDIVQGYLDWADYSVSNGEGLVKIEPTQAPISTALDILGMPGMTAYFGLLDIGRPERGETVVVSGAAGAVGMAVGQIAKIQGCKVIGIAGTEEKVAYLKNELGFDAALNYKSPNFKELLSQACAKGVDVYFDNVGGDVTDRVMELINPKARIVVCGQISMYNLEKPDIGTRHFRALIIKRATAQGFIVNLDYKERFPEGMHQMLRWLKQGKIKSKETVVEGLENAPQAFIGLFKGENIGKQLVRVNRD